MSEDSVQINYRSSRKRYSRAFRPLTSWIVISLLLLIWDYHRRHAPLTTLRFDVRIDGKSVHPSAYTATLGKRRVEPGTVAPIGWRRLRVSIPDAGIFEKKLFVWYGENVVGDIPLEWNQGVLDLKIEPLARYVHLVGPHYTFSLTNSFGKKVSIPVGTYKVSAVFDRLSEQHEVFLGANETNQFMIRASAGTLNLSSQPSSAKYSLAFQGRNAFSVEGNVPATMTGLPVGNYQLRVWRDDYAKEVPVSVKKWETNEIAVRFEYGSASLASDPDGATIFSGAKELGQTPKTLTELKPGAHRFRLEKPGYTPVEITIDVEGTNTISVSTNLLSVRYTEGLMNARREAGGLSPDYRKALSQIELALTEKPNDPDALALKSEIEIALRGQQERETQQKKLAEIAARKRAAVQHFEQATGSIRQAELFDTHRWEFRSQKDKIRAALLKAFNRSSPNWTVEKEVALNADTVLFYCKPKGMLALGKQLVVLASQVDTDEVHVYAKFWDYILSNKVSISIFRGVSPDSLIPIHKSSFPADQAPAIEARRRELAENFRAVLQNELR